MSEAGTVDAATKRLALALDGLEAALDRRRESDRSEETLGAQIQALGIDRSRLAADLDGQAARSRRLEGTSREVASRLDNAIQSIRSLLAGHER